MAKKKKTVRFKTDSLIEGLLTILLGILFLILQGQVVTIAMTVLGVVLLVLAVLDLLENRVPSAIVKAVFGVVTLLFGWVITTAALYVLAALLLIWGIYELYAKLHVHLKGNSLGLTVLLYISPILNILLGLLLLFNQGGTLAWIFIVVGVLLILDGAMLLCGLVRPKKRSR